ALKAPRAEMAARWLWLLALCAAAASPPPDAEVTFVLPAGRRECFYQAAPGNASMEAEYQVGGGPCEGGVGPENGDGGSRVPSHPPHPGVPGTWGAQSPILENIPRPASAPTPPVLTFQELGRPWSPIPTFPEEAVVQCGVANTPLHPQTSPSHPQESIETMRSRLERSIQVQTLLRAFEARDRNLQESNLGRVNFWSAVNLAVLVLVATVQVRLLKSLFQDKRPVRT
ncbi:TMED1 protein, partial [Centropus bengalensis]|nr:TMED1 protein [Centropus bengalensis]